MPQVSVSPAIKWEDGNKFNGLIFGRRIESMRAGTTSDLSSFHSEAPSFKGSRSRGSPACHTSAGLQGKLQPRPWHIFLVGYAQVQVNRDCNPYSTRSPQPMWTKLWPLAHHPCTSPGSSPQIHEPKPTVSFILMLAPQINVHYSLQPHIPKLFGFLLDQEYLPLPPLGLSRLSFRQDHAHVPSLLLQVSILCLLECNRNGSPAHDLLLTLCDSLPSNCSLFIISDLKCLGLERRPSASRLSPPCPHM